MDLPNEVESRAVLLRAFPAPAAAELERAWSNVTLLRQRRPQVSRAGWSTAAGIAAAITLLVAGAGAGWLVRSPGRAAVTVRPVPHLAMEPASVPTSIPFSGARGVRVRYWFFPYGGGRTLLEDRYVPLPPGHDLRISSAEEMTSTDFSAPRFAVDLAFHTLLNGGNDSVVMIGAHLMSALPAFGETEPRGQFVTEARVRSNTVLRRNQSAWIFPFHSSRDAARGGTGLEVWLDGEAGDFILPAMTQGAGNIAPIVIETARRLQAVSLRIELSDSGGPWRTVTDRHRLFLSRGGSNQVFIGGPYPRGHLLVAFQLPPFGHGTPLCFTWEWGDRRPPRGSFCFGSRQDTVVTPVYGSGGKRLRVTLLERHDTLPF